MSGKRDSASKAVEDPAEGPDAEAVAAFLRRHPEFLNEHPDLLSTLTPPERRQGESVVDFQGYMLETLREEVTRQASREKLLISISEANVEHQARAHQAAIRMLNMSSPEELVDWIGTEMADMLRLKAAIVVAPPKSPLASIDGVQTQKKLASMLRGSDVILMNEFETPPVNFATGDDVASVALIAMEVSYAPAAIALASEDDRMFHPNQATDLLSFMGRVAETVLQRWINTPS